MLVANRSPSDWFLDKALYCDEKGHPVAARVMSLFLSAPFSFSSSIFNGGCCILKLPFSAVYLGVRCIPFVGKSYAARLPKGISPGYVFRHAYKTAGFALSIFISPFIGVCSPGFNRRCHAKIYLIKIKDSTSARKEESGLTPLKPSLTQTARPQKKTAPAQHPYLMPSLIDDEPVSSGPAKPVMPRVLPKPMLLMQSPILSRKEGPELSVRLPEKNEARKSQQTVLRSSKTNVEETPEDSFQHLAEPDDNESGGILSFVSRMVFGSSKKAKKDPEARKANPEKENNETPKDEIEWPEDILRYTLPSLIEISEKSVRGASEDPQKTQRNAEIQKQTELIKRKEQKNEVGPAFAAYKNNWMKSQKIGKDLFKTEKPAPSVPSEEIPAMPQHPPVAPPPPPANTVPGAPPPPSAAPLKPVQVTAAPRYRTGAHCERWTM